MITAEMLTCNFRKKHFEKKTLSKIRESYLIFHKELLN